MPSPDTVTEAVEFLARQGYVDDFTLCVEGIVARNTDGPHPISEAVVDYTFRFEGPSDPGDEAIVLGVTCTRWDRKGTIVSADGPDADPEEATLLFALARRARADVDLDVDEPGSEPSLSGADDHLD